MNGVQPMSGGLPAYSPNGREQVLQEMTRGLPEDELTFFENDGLSCAVHRDGTGRYRGVYLAYPCDADKDVYTDEKEMYQRFQSLSLHEGIKAPILQGIQAQYLSSEELHAMAAIDRTYAEKLSQINASLRYCFDLIKNDSYDPTAGIDKETLEAEIYRLHVQHYQLSQSMEGEKNLVKQQFALRRSRILIE